MNLESPDVIKARVRDAWDQNAATWDSYMGDQGNDWTQLLVWKPTDRLLDVKPGQRILDVGCGNGNYCRRLARRGVHVVGIDFSGGMIERAHAYSAESSGSVEYKVVDATDALQLAELGRRSFDSAVSNMAIMDMAAVNPLFQALAGLLRPGGAFVFSVMHPCFNGPATLVLEEEDRDGQYCETYSVKVSRYLDTGYTRGRALRAQPVPQYYFHRPISQLLAGAFESGFILDAMEEPAFPKDSPPASRLLGWGPGFSQIPPVLVVRLRLKA